MSKRLTERDKFIRERLADFEPLITAPYTLRMIELSMEVAWIRGAMEATKEIKDEFITTRDERD